MSQPQLHEVVQATFDASWGLVRRHPFRHDRASDDSDAAAPAAVKAEPVDDDDDDDDVGDVDDEGDDVAVDEDEDDDDDLEDSGGGNDGADADDDGGGLAAAGDGPRTVDDGQPLPLINIIPGFDPALGPLAPPLSEGQFLKQLKAFLKRRGTPLVSLPMYGGSTLDVYGLFLAVMALGGAENVSATQGGWRTVWESLGNYVTRMGNPTVRTRAYYLKFLYEYEWHIVRGRSERLDMAALYRRHFPGGRVVFTGATPGGKNIRTSEAAAARAAAGGGVLPPRGVPVPVSRLRTAVRMRVDASTAPATAADVLGSGGGGGGGSGRKRSRAADGGGGNGSGGDDDDDDDDDEGNDAELLRHVKRDADGRPVLPLTIGGGSLELLALGEVVPNDPAWVGRKYVFPCGFRSSREFGSMVTPRARVVYTSEIVASRAGTSAPPVFRVTASDNPRKPVEAGSPTAAWQFVATAVDALKAPEDRRKSTISLSGPYMFGLSHPIIRALTRELPNYDKAADFGRRPRKRLRA